MKVAVIFQRFGPYHVARLKACASIFDAVGIELCVKDSTYQWETVPNETSFKKITLFHEEHPQPLLLRKRISEILSELQPDIVAVPGWSLRGCLAAIDWSLKKRVPFVLMSDSQFEDKQRLWFAEWFKSRVVRLANAALVAGSRHFEYLCKLGLRKDDIYTGYDVVDNQHFSCLNENNSRNKSHKRHFIAVCRFVPEKNLLSLIDVYGDYYKVTGEDSYELILVGDGPLREQIMNRICSSGLESKIHLMGFLQYDDLPELYHDASILVHPSRVEPWGLVVNEAMASGLPVLVSSKCGCTPELVRQGVNGYTFDPDDRKQWLELMIKMSGDKSVLAAMGQASREIIQDWTPDKFARSLYNAACHAEAKQMKRYGVLDRVLLNCLYYR